MSLVALIGWIAALALAGVCVLLAMNKESGLKLIQHRTDMLPQVMLVRYLALTALAGLALVFGAPRLLFTMLLTLSLIAFGDAYVYRRAGHPHWIHLAGGALTGIGAVLALFSFN